MKAAVKKILQTVLGFRNYLFTFAKYKIRTLRNDKKEGDFFTFLDMIESPQIILDVGANIGVMTYFLSQRFQDAEVHAYEPIPHNLDTLNRIIRKYEIQNVTVHDCALGKEPGKVRMIMPVVSAVKMHGLSHVKHDSITEYNEGNEFEVACSTLDIDFAAQDKRISAIKMDVENFEHFVLEGAKETIRKHQPIIYTELWENDNRTNCFRIMKEHGYATHVVVGGIAVPYDPNVHRTQNFIFIPQ